MTSPLLNLTIFELITALVCTAATMAVALWYLRRVRMERPAIGRFNGRDVVVLFAFLVALPTLYLLLPQWALTGFLALTFVASLSIGLRPLTSRGPMWLVIGLLIGANIWLARTMLGTVWGWQVFWVENSVIVLLGAVSVANLYVQGGMHLRHVAWFAFLLAGYDLIFTTVVPVTNDLAEHFIGFPLDPSMGFRLGFDNSSIGLGDLLVYALFATAAFKAYGRSAARFAMGLIIVFGVAMPALTPLLINSIDARADVLVPAQTWFGPFAFLGYLWLRRRYGRERTMREFLAGNDIVRPRADRAPRREPAVEPAGVN